MATFDLLKPAPGLRVLVTGGAAGIGLTIAKAFDEADARVYVCDIDPAAVAAVTEAHPSIGAGVADVANRESVDRLVDAAAEALGGLDVVVNNAGISGPTGAIEDLEPDDWDRTVSTNLNSQFYVLRRAVPILKRSPAAGIVAMSSVAGRLGYPFRTPYASTKWAIAGLVKSLAMELGRDGVRVNAVLPGPVAGPRMDRVIAARAQALGLGFDEMKAEYLTKISLGRMVTESDIAATTLFLCSPAARNITGQAISVDGNVEHL
ncbi:NAD(P)-dependent dehydrogenase, short-chain alcohol dehydrogenase family [Methylobacterium sp. ap11]|uniref:SDR family oxidoreductase n=1 Tax=Methylobacterium sp. ap11 TaxID=1761799 RepID=UPI0008D5AF9F|nr:SDR family oxidoreductase [Methylobacterium sp. ap11]SEP47994.1 NAD(P)-dependent dehydrogenase, short-chain alcohol dehydrogenase family [Methylobacterium sp. ap11]